MRKRGLCFIFFIVLLILVDNVSADLVLYWNLDESSGTTAFDSVGDNHGMLIGDTAWDPTGGKFDGAALFDGTDDSIRLTAEAGPFPVSDYPFTLMGWCKSTKGTAKAVIVAMVQAPFQYYWIGLKGGQATVTARDGGMYEQQAGTGIADDQWHHLCGVYNGPEDRVLYLDGVEVATDTLSIPFITGIRRVAVGALDRDPAGENIVDEMVGSVDSVAIFSEALDVDTINHYMMNGISTISAVASRPSPSDGTLHEDTWINLSWRAGDFAVSHDIYIGDDFDAVNEGAESTFVGNQTDTFIVAGFPGFPIPDGLLPGTTYYWRIDEVNEAEPNSPWKDPIWSFSIPPKTAYFPDPANDAEGVSVDVRLNWTPGYGSKLHTVYFGETFDEVDNAVDGSAQGTATYDPGTLKMAKTYYWRVDEFDIIETYKGDVWNFTTEGGVSSPNPAKDAVDVTQIPVLTWAPGLGATHEIYFGSDAGALEKKASGNLGDESFEPGQLEWNTTYYWRVDEANSANADSPWTGPLWSFTTANFLIIDDMESYNDINEGEPDSNRIYLAWIDGFDNPTINGSVVGNVNAPFAEQTIIHSGNQSMPMAYDNAVEKSEATLTLTDKRNWTVNGVDTLAIWFRGASSNAAEQMYVALNDSARIDHDDPDAATLTSWTQWNIPLQAFADQGVNLSNVNSITLGLSSGSGGIGIMYFDDIRLYAP